MDILVLGESGAGKTYLVATIEDVPDAFPALFLDTDRGDITARGFNVELHYVKDWNDAKGIKTGLSSEAHNYKTIIIDSLSELYEMALADVKKKKNHEIPELSDYGHAKSYLASYIRELRMACESQGMNLVLTAPIKVMKDDTTGRTEILPALGSETARAMCRAVNSIGLMEKDPKTGARCLRFDGVRNCSVLKLRTPKGVVAPEKIDKPTMSNIFEYVRPHNS